MRDILEGKKKVWEEVLNGNHGMGQVIVWELVWQGGDRRASTDPSWRSSSVG
jgi:hypothetical protein